MYRPAKKYPLIVLRLFRHIAYNNTSDMRHPLFIPTPRTATLVTVEFKSFWRTGLHYHAHHDSAWAISPQNSIFWPHPWSAVTLACPSTSPSLQIKSNRITLMTNTDGRCHGSQQWRPTRRVDIENVICSLSGLQIASRCTTLQSARAAM